MRFHRSPTTDGSRMRMPNAATASRSSLAAACKFASTLKRRSSAKNCPDGNRAVSSVRSAFTSEIVLPTMGATSSHSERSAVPSMGESSYLMRSSSPNLLMARAAASCTRRSWSPNSTSVSKARIAPRRAGSRRSNSEMRLNLPSPEANNSTSGGSKCCVCACLTATS